MQNYFISTLYSIIFLVIVDVFISKTNNGKAVQTIISLISVLILALPIVNVIKNNTLIINESNIDLNYQIHLQNLEKDILKNNVESALKRENIEFIRVDLIYLGGDVTSINKIIITPKNLVLTNSSEHIDMLERVNLTLKNVINTGECEVLIETV